MTRRTSLFAITALLIVASLVLPVAGAAPLLTGVVEDSSAQTIEMPSLPGAWQRRVEWMADEGSRVEVGDPVVRLDPGDLITREEQLRTDLEKVRLTAARRIDELKLLVMDAEKAVAQAASNVRLAELDAVIPERTIPKLDYERYQLALETAEKTRIRAEAELLLRRAELEDVMEETALEIRQAESNYERIRLALEATEIRAEKVGFVIYGDNPFTGKKVFPGETLYTGFEVASIASQEDLQIRFWIHEADILNVRQGQTIEVAADAQGTQSFSTRLAWTSSQAVEKQDWSDSGYFEALAVPMAPLPTEIMPGMSVLGVVGPRETDR
jgi:multidrug resistance efflux pump